MGRGKLASKALPATGTGGASSKDVLVHEEQDWRLRRLGEQQELLAQVDAVDMRLWRFGERFRGERFRGEPNHEALGESGQYISELASSNLPCGLPRLDGGNDAGLASKRSSSSSSKTLRVGLPKVRPRLAGSSVFLGWLCNNDAGPGAASAIVVPALRTHFFQNSAPALATGSVAVRR